MLATIQFVASGSSLLQGGAGQYWRVYGRIADEPCATRTNPGGSKRVVPLMYHMVSPTLGSGSSSSLK